MYTYKYSLYLFSLNGVEGVCGLFTEGDCCLESNVAEPSMILGPFIKIFNACFFFSNFCKYFCNKMSDSFAFFFSNSLLSFKYSLFVFKFYYVIKMNMYNMINIL